MDVLALAAVALPNIWALPCARQPGPGRQSGPENRDAAWHQCQRIDVHPCTPFAHKAKMWKLERGTLDMGDDMGARGSETHLRSCTRKGEGRGKGKGGYLS